MPKTAASMIIWSPEHNRYHAYEQSDQHPRALDPGTPLWREWLETHASFAFKGKYGHLTLRKESRPRGTEHYWYAYRHQGTRTTKKYVGRASHLTLERIEETARELALKPATAEDEPGARSKARSKVPLVTPITPLLAPKLCPPQLHTALVFRRQLLSQLDSGLERKTTLLSAPPGSGKTTLVSQWLHEHGKRQPSPVVAWIALDAADNDSVRFWRYLLTAYQNAVPHFGHAALAQLQTPTQQPFDYAFLETMLATFLNELSALTKPSMLVLEDYHVITSTRLHEMLTFLIDHLPAMAHVIIITRSDPPLPLPRWRARNELNEINTTELRFSEEETDTFLQQIMPQPPSLEVVKSLTTHTEGWATGLRLATFTLREHFSQSEIEHSLLTFSGGHRHILDYLVTEVLNSQPAPIQQFLLQTAILPCMTGSLCDALTGQHESHQRLVQLEHANLFLSSLDEAGQWYRYHALFAEAMQQEARCRLGDEALRALYSRASIWYEEHMMADEAIEASLHAQAFERVMMLIGRTIGPQHFLQIHEYDTLRRWLGQIPEQLLATDPDFCHAYAILLLFVPNQPETTNNDQFERPLQLAERTWQANGETNKLGEALAMRALAWKRKGDTSLALTIARQALTLLPEDEVIWRSIAVGVVANSEYEAGQLNVASQGLHEAYTLSLKTGNTHTIRAMQLMLADLYVGQRALHRAAESYRQTLTIAEDDLTDKTKALLGLASLAYEWNELEMAQQKTQKILDADEHALENTILVRATLIQARVLHARQQSTQALQRLTTLLHSIQPQQSPTLYREILAAQAAIHLATGNLVDVQRWQATIQRNQELPYAQQEQEDFLLARLLIAQGEINEAWDILHHRHIEAHGAGRLQSELQVLILKALTLVQRKDGKKASQIIREVLALAYIEGYQRIFLNEGETMATLLRTTLPALKENDQATYVRTLLHSFALEQVDVQNLTSPASLSLNEPLSQQEQRVLRLLMAGRSNPEIAETLIVSINTVKAHVKSIYRKLDVNNRMEASAIARRLQLLPPE